MATKYAVKVNGEPTGQVSTVKQTALAKGLEVLKASELGTIVTVETEAGTKVFNRVRTQRVVTKRTAPYTREETVAQETFEAVAGDVPAGYVLAYRRPRNQTSVFRNPNAVKGENYGFVKDEVTGDVYTAQTTRQAGAIMRNLAASR